MTGRVNFGILIGNMTRNSGYFYETHNKYRKFWAVMRCSTEDSNLDSITGDQGCADSYRSTRRSTAGIQTPSGYASRDCPPLRKKTLDPVGVGTAGGQPQPARQHRRSIRVRVDVAWLGKDRSTICKRRGPKVEEIVEFRGVDPMQLVGGWCVTTRGEGEGEAPQAIFVDTIGMGAGVYTRLREQGYPAVSVIVSETANDKAQ